MNVFEVPHEFLLNTEEACYTCKPFVAFKAMSMNQYYEAKKRFAFSVTFCFQDVFVRYAATANSEIFANVFIQDSEGGLVLDLYYYTGIDDLTANYISSYCLDEEGLLGGSLVTEKRMYGTLPEGE